MATSTRTTTLVTTREAIRRICDLHMIGKVEANRVLTSGLAGPGRQRGGAIVYDEGRLAELLARPRCTDQTLDTVRPLIVRLGRGRRFDLSQSWEEQAEVARRSWYVPGRAARAWFEPIKETWLPLEHGPAVTVWGAPVYGTLREVDWLRVDAEKQKRQLEQEMWLRSAPALRDAAQVGLTSADAILRAWNDAAPPSPEKTGQDGAA